MLWSEPHSFPGECPYPGPDYTRGIGTSAHTGCGHRPLASIPYLMRRPLGANVYSFAVQPVSHGGLTTLDAPAIAYKPLARSDSPALKETDLEKAAASWKLCPAAGISETTSPLFQGSTSNSTKYWSLRISSSSCCVLADRYTTATSVTAPRWPGRCRILPLTSR